MPPHSFDSQPTPAQFALALLVLKSKPIGLSLEGAEASRNQSDHELSFSAGRSYLPATALCSIWEPDLPEAP